MKKHPLNFTLSLLTLSAALALTSPSHAVNQVITLTVTDYGSIPVGPARDALDTAILTMQTQINTDFPDINVTSFSESSAKSASLASSGVGVDYASDFDFGYLATNVGVASDVSPSNLSDRINAKDYPGIGAALALTAGLNLKHFPAIPIVSQIFAPERTRAYVSLLSLGHKFDIDSATGSAADLSCTILSAQGQYKLVPGYSVGLGFFKWGGVDISGGIRYTSAHVSINAPLQDITIHPDLSSSGMGTGNVAFSGNSVVSVNMKTFTIPVEISTSTRLLHLFGLFVGAGGDINLGSTSSALNIDGPVAITNTGGLDIGNVQAQATAGLTGSGKPSFVNLKSFAGMQVEFLAVAFSVQATRSLLNSVTAVNLGVKAFW